MEVFCQTQRQRGQPNIFETSIETNNVMLNGLETIPLVSLSVMGSVKELSLLQFYSQSILMSCFSFSELLGLAAISMACSLAVLDMLMTFSSSLAADLVYRQW